MASPPSIRERVITALQTQFPSTNRLSALQRLQENIRMCMGDNAEQFCNILYRTNVLLAGGFVARSICDLIVDYADMDLYVSKRDAKQFFQSIFTMPHFTGRTIFENVTPQYDKSFMRKNGILMRMRIQRSSRQHSMDVIIIDDVSTPRAVTSNFDLTCCETVFNGRVLYGRHLDLTMQKITILRAEYRAALPNRFIQNRIIKYQKLGFVVHMEPIPLMCVLPNYFNRIKKILHVENVANWIMTQVLKDVITVVFQNPVNAHPNVHVDAAIFFPFESTPTMFEQNEGISGRQVIDVTDGELQGKLNAMYGGERFRPPRHVSSFIGNNRHVRDDAGNDVRERRPNLAQSVVERHEFVNHADRERFMRMLEGISGTVHRKLLQIFNISSFRTMNDLLARVELISNRDVCNKLPFMLKFLIDFALNYADRRSPMNAVRDGTAAYIDELNEVRRIISRSAPMMSMADAANYPLNNQITHVPLIKAMRVDEMSNILNQRVFMATDNTCASGRSQDIFNIARLTCDDVDERWREIAKRLIEQGMVRTLGLDSMHLFRWMPAWCNTMNNSKGMFVLGIKVQPFEQMDQYNIHHTYCSERPINNVTYLVFDDDTHAALVRLCTFSNPIITMITDLFNRLLPNRCQDRSDLRRVCEAVLATNLTFVRQVTVDDLMQQIMAIQLIDASDITEDDQRIERLVEMTADEFASSVANEIHSDTVIQTAISQASSNETCNELLIIIQFACLLTFTIFSSYIDPTVLANRVYANIRDMDTDNDPFFAAIITQNTQDDMLHVMQRLFTLNDPELTTQLPNNFDTYLPSVAMTIEHAWATCAAKPSAPHRDEFVVSIEDDTMENFNYIEYVNEHQLLCTHLAICLLFNWGSN